MSICNRVFRNWHWYLFSFFGCCGGENESFDKLTHAIVVKYYNYSVEQRNHYPTQGICCWCSSHYNPGISFMLSARETSLAMGIIIGIFTTIAAAYLLPSQTTQLLFCFPIFECCFVWSNRFFSSNVVCINDLQERPLF